MKRSAELTALSREHHQALKLAKQCLDAVTSGDRKRIRALCEEIATTFDDTWERHFRNEESAIFSITEKMGGGIQKLGRHLAEEHDQMRAMARQMQAGDCQSLQTFGVLLRSHTRLEERKLFPLIERNFSTQQLREIQSSS